MNASKCILSGFLAALMFAAPLALPSDKQGDTLADERRKKSNSRIFRAIYAGHKEYERTSGR
jgi:hypothetical protein